MAKQEEEAEHPQVEPRYWKVEQVAQYLSVSVAQAYALVRSGELPAIKIGGRGVWRVNKQKLDAYLERLEKETTQWARAHPLNPREREQDARELE